jgi:hypothetical protein
MLYILSNLIKCFVHLWFKRRNIYKKQKNKHNTEFASFFQYSVDLRIDKAVKKVYDIKDKSADSKTLKKCAKKVANQC